MVLRDVIINHSFSAVFTNTPTPKHIKSTQCLHTEIDIWIAIVCVSQFGD